ncbi:HNH endonuclease [Candidatus Poribacteria bacterium]|nr:HNH endonuclease [Candidatus Poribacteria bacterium]
MDGKLRLTVLERDDFTCQACGRKPAGQVHHIKPRSQGGLDSLSNLITLCGRCHMIISPVPSHALWNAFRVPKENILREKAKIENAIVRQLEKRLLGNPLEMHKNWCRKL